MVLHIIRRFCSYATAAIAKLFGISTDFNYHDDAGEGDQALSNDRASVLFSVGVDSSLASIAPMSSLNVSEPSSSMAENETETESSSPGLDDTLASIFQNTSTSDFAFAQDVSDDKSAECNGDQGALVTPLEHDTKSISVILQGNSDENTSELRPYNLFQDRRQSLTGLSASSISIQSITPNKSGIDTAHNKDGSLRFSSTSIASHTKVNESGVVNDKKKYPVTPYPPSKLPAFSSPVVQQTNERPPNKLPKSVMLMRRGLVKSRVGHIQKKLDEQLQEQEERS